MHIQAAPESKSEIIKKVYQHSSKSANLNDKQKQHLKELSADNNRPKSTGSTKHSNLVVGNRLPPSIKKKKK